MTKKDNGNELMISKLIVAIMIVVILLAAGVYLWMDYNKESDSSSNSTSTEQAEVDEQSAEEVDENTTLDSEAVGDEIDSLDQEVNSINDDTLSEDSLSDKDLGI
jgi:flagellar basal body-associated protein FliL